MNSLQWHVKTTGDKAYWTEEIRPNNLSGLGRGILVDALEAELGEPEPFRSLSEQTEPDTVEHCLIRLPNETVTRATA